MSNLYPVNLNNLDGRYTKLADVNAAIATQAAADTGQYTLTNYLNYINKVV